MISTPRARLLLVLLSLFSFASALRRKHPAGPLRLIKRGYAVHICYPNITANVDILSIEDVATSYWKPRPAAMGKGFAAIDLMPDMMIPGTKTWKVKPVADPLAPNGTYTLAAVGMTKMHSRQGCISSAVGNPSMPGNMCVADDPTPVEWAISCTACDPLGVSASNCQIKSVLTGLCATHVSGSVDTEVKMTTCTTNDGDSYPQGWLLTSY
ncbi:hypothetical protein P7C70_g4849, partial [Phenoliferia sp. Uapishka_3]